MKKEKNYEPVRFSADVLQEASREFLRQADPEDEHERRYTLGVEVDDAEWEHESLEEFLADYRKGGRGANYWVKLGDSRYGYLRVHVFTLGSYAATRVSVEATTRSTIEAIFDVFEKHVEESRIPAAPEPPKEKPTVFIGHGHSPLWKHLKDHLHDKQGYKVEAYEIGARAGHTMRDILEDMLDESTFAILVMTGEDETKDDELNPRLNVVHELGLFQGHLGFSRAIMLLEEGTSELSNMHGVDQIRFSKGNIREVFGDVLATLRREFPVEPD